MGPVLVCFGVGVHFFPLATVLKTPRCARSAGC
jgi:hypothetical protein